MIETVDDIFPAPALAHADLFRPFADRLKGKKILEGDEERIGKYDVVLLDDATQVMAARELLLPGGALFLTVRNAAGMGSLWDQASSDNGASGDINASSEDGPSGADRFSSEGGIFSLGLGKQRITHLAREAGFSQCCFYYPFPDTTSPSVLLAEAGIGTLDVGNLIEPVLGDYPPSLIERLVANGLITEVSDYFFVILSDNPYWLPDPHLLAWTFNPGRTAYKKVNTFYRSRSGLIRVRREADGGRPEGLASIRQVLSEEAYVSGRLYSLELKKIAAVAGWSAADVAGWAARWLDLLRQHVMVTGTGEWLEGRYLDMVPFNLIVSGEQLSAIDLEWVAGEYLPLGYVFFRGLYHSLARLGAVAQPAIGTPINLYGLCLDVASRFLENRPELLETFLALEPYYFGQVFNGHEKPPEDTDLVLRPEKLSPASQGKAKLYPLANLNLQVFVESEGQPFSEETSALLPIALMPERKTYTVLLPHFTADVVRLRIDPSDHSGMLHFHSLRLCAGSQELFCWTPFSSVEVAVHGVVLLDGIPTLSNPVMILLDHDPMLIFSLPNEGPIQAFTAMPMQSSAGTPPQPAAVTLEVEVSELGPGVYEGIMARLGSLCE